MLVILAWEASPSCNVASLLVISLVILLNPGKGKKGAECQYFMPTQAGTRNPLIFNVLVRYTLERS